MKTKRPKLKLNKEILGNLLDDEQMEKVVGGIAFLSLWGSNCNNTDTTRHNCCIEQTNKPKPTCTFLPPQAEMPVNPALINLGQTVSRGVQITQTINTANPNLDGTGTITNLITGDASSGFGTQVTQVIVKAPKPVNQGMIRFFINGTSSDSGFTLALEVPVEPTSQTGTSESFQQVIPFEGLLLAPNVILGVSTETSDTFVVTAYGMDVLGYV